MQFIINTPIISCINPNFFVAEDFKKMDRELNVLCLSDFITVLTLL